MAEANKNLKGSINSLNVYHTDAYAVAVRNGFKGTVAEWLESLNGESAYDIAVKNGYKGTEKEWLASLTAEADGKAQVYANQAGNSATAAKGSENNAQKSAEESQAAAEEAKKTAEELNSIYDTALDSIIAIQNELIENGATPPAVYIISGSWQFNEKAKAELGVNATLGLAKTNVNFTSGGMEFVAIDCSDSSCQYWGADGYLYPIHESGMFDCYGLDDDVLDFGDEPQVVTEEFLAWIDYYMI